MKSFSGFTSAGNRAVPLPLEFFTELLSEIDELGELKITLYTFWYISHLESKIKFVSLKDFIEDKVFLSGFPGKPKEKEKAVEESLAHAVERGTLLTAVPPADESKLQLFFLNSKEGRAAFSAYQKEYWTPEKGNEQTILLNSERPNIFKLYEENMGPLTPLIAETLQDAEKIYPVDWIEEAIKAAVKNNVRRWKYVEAILTRWKEEGRNEKDRRDHQEDRKKYLEGEYGDLIKH
jgi:DnaD/phage-associated family protein